MDDMPRPPWPHLQKRITRHGKVTWYVRVGRGPLIRLKAAYGTPEFAAAYRRALQGDKTAPAASAKAGTLHWLIDRYRESAPWLAFSPATRRQRDNIFRQLITTAGAEPVAAITPKVIVAALDRRRGTPYQARHVLDTLRGLFTWATAAQLATRNPTLGILEPATPKTGGFRPWTEDDVAKYQRRWPRGTRQYVWLAVLLFTGLRRGDAVLLGRQHAYGGGLRIVTEKTGTLVFIAIQPGLADAIATGPTGDLAFICGARREPMTKESFGNEFRDACRAAGIRKSAHGLRKLAATRAAMNGATTSQLNALFGWTGARMAAHYTREADRERLAREAAHLMNNVATTSLKSGSSELESKAKSGT